MFTHYPSVFPSSYPYAHSSIHPSIRLVIHLIFSVLPSTYHVSGCVLTNADADMKIHGAIYTTLAGMTWYAYYTVSDEWGRKQ